MGKKLVKNRNLKCSFCDKKAEYYLPDESGKPKSYFCEDHAIKWLKEGRVSYLPRIKSLKIKKLK